MDIISLGAAAAQTKNKPYVLMSQGRCGPIYGATAGAGFQHGASIVIPANTIKGGELIEFSAMIEKYQPLNAGMNVRITMGGVTILQSTLDATVCHYPLDHRIMIADDRKSAFTGSLNAYGKPAGKLIDSTSSVTLENTLLRNNNPGPGAVLGTGARAPSSTIMFVSYASAAGQSAETTLVDFTQPVVVNIDIAPISGDTAEVVAPFMRISRIGSAKNIAVNPKLIHGYGDSLSEGNNAWAVANYPMDYGSQIRRALPGYPVDVRGLGGQVGAQISSRVLSDPISCTLARLWVWLGTNDINADGPTWFAAIQAALDPIVKARAGYTPPVFFNMHPRFGWATNSAYYLAMQYVNAQMLSRYGASVICDVFSALATIGGQSPISNYATAHTTGTIASGSPTLTVANATGIVVGQQVYSPGSTAIDNGAGVNSAVTVTAVAGTTITLSANASAALNAADVCFVSNGEVHFSNAGHTAVKNQAVAKFTALNW